MGRYLVMLVMVLAVTGCVQQRQSNFVPLSVEDRMEYATPLICIEKSECDIWWQRAQIWLTKNSAWKIQTATDYVITTYYPSRRDVTWGYQVTREPVEGEPDQQAININLVCRLVDSECVPDRTQSVISFKRYVRTGQ